ncbi:ATP-binding protein [Pyxidicoccus sp. 3LG]
MSAAFDVRGVTSQRTAPAVLLVEDSEADVLALQRTLQPLGVALVCVASGEEALEALPEHEFVAALLDIHLAGAWDGFETARRIREDSRHHTLPLLFMTGAPGDTLQVVRAYRAGAVDFLHKPLIPEQLSAKVALFLELWHARDREREDLRARESVALRRAEEERRRVDALNATLVAQQEWLQSVLRRLPIPLVLVEAGSARILFANDLADEHWGGAFPRTESAAEYASDFTVTDQEGRAIAISEFPAVRAARGETVSGVQFIVHTPRGKRVFLTDIAQVPAQGERPPSAVVTFQDITHLKDIERTLREREQESRFLAEANDRLYQASREAVRLRDEFISVASHELRTPLTPITLKVQALRRHARSAPAGSLPVDKVEPVLEAVSLQVKRLTRLVDDLLEVSRISAGHLEVHPEPMELTALLREVTTSLEPECTRAGCRLVLHAPLAVTGHWDRPRLEQVLNNLLSNALKYGAGRPIHVRAEAVGRDAVITVRDEGIGITPEALPRVFGKFERAVSERHYGGLGLGLFIARQLVEAHGGTIRVESQPGQGACFEVVLPLFPILS